MIGSEGKQVIDQRLIGKPVYDVTNKRKWTVKGLLTDGRLIVTDQWGQYMVVALGDVWKLDRQTEEALSA